MGEPLEGCYGQSERTYHSSEPRDLEHQKSWKNFMKLCILRMCIGGSRKLHKIIWSVFGPELSDFESRALSTFPLGLPPALTPPWSDSLSFCVLSGMEPFAWFLTFVPWSWSPDPALTHLLDLRSPRCFCSCQVPRMGLLVNLLDPSPCWATALCLAALLCLHLPDWQWRTLENFPFLEESQPVEIKPFFSCSIFSETRGQMVIILHVEGKKKKKRKRKTSPTIKTEMTSM